MRKLASIQEIAWKRPIEGKDRIELCGVLGWSLITKKDEFQVGDKCIYVEIDSVMPEKPEFEFLRNKKFRIKTMKLGNVYSQGICFPLSLLPDGDYMIGDDVTDMLGVHQYEPTMDKDPDVDNQNKKNKSWLMRFRWYRRLFGKVNKKYNDSFPTEYVKKTDEVRIQSCPWCLDDKNTKWVATEKIDGSSGTFLMIRHKHKIKKDTFEFKVCSRNKTLAHHDGSAYWFVAEKYDIENKLKKLLIDNNQDEWIALQGEVIGPKIQLNKYKVEEPDLYIFNVLTPQGRVDSVAGAGFCSSIGLKFVPIHAVDVTLPNSVNEILEVATGTSEIGDTLREGFVYRSMDGKQSFKAVSPKFLIKYDE